MKIEILYSKKSNKFLLKHKKVKTVFEKNIVSFYKGDENIDIKLLKSHKGFFRMRINSYRIIFTVKNGEIIIVEVIDAGNRGDIYKKY